MGEVFRPGDEANPDGYFEDLDWRAVNKWLINTAGGTWYDPPSRAEILKQAQRIESLLCAFVLWKSKASTWGFKDPRTCLTAHAIHQHLIDPHYIVVRRPEAEIVDSLIHRSGIRGYKESRRHWIALTERYIALMNQFLDNYDPRSIEIQYGDLISDRETARKQLAYLAGFLELPATGIEEAMRLIRFRDEL
jgi:hypothetical protein